MSIWTMLADEAAQFTATLRDQPLLPDSTPQELRDALEARYQFAYPIAAEDLTAEVMQLLRTSTVHVTHPRYFGLFNPSVRPITVIADALVALYNPQLAAWSHAPGANEIERLTLRFLMRALGWEPDSAIAHFTTGGAEANLSALLAALAQYIPTWSEDGIAGIAERPAIYLTSESHHSFVKAARMAGLGTASLRVVATSADGTLDPQALASQIGADRRMGWRPLLVVGTVGTTGAGLIDPLPEIAAIARREELWFHADAAWGGAAALTPTLRPLLAGIEQADSVTWDAHKWLSVPMAAGMFFCRHPNAVQRAFAVTTSYMPESATSTVTVDSYVTSVQWSRRAIGLKVFMALAELGAEGYATQIMHQATMGDLLREQLTAAGWLVVNATQLPVVCFTHADIRAGVYTTRDVLGVIYQRKRVWISEVVVSTGEQVLRACITSFATSPDDIACLVAELAYARTRLG
jgi:aromatic-L-amino-acid decarboxylase